MKLTVNGKTIETDRAPLKEVLAVYGLKLPCRGQGKCGRCKIHCPALPPTAQDARFLSPAEIEGGIRLACDKTASDGLEITFRPSEETIGYKLKEADAKLYIGEGFFKIALFSMDGDFVDEIVFPLPEKPSTRTLRADIVKPMLELFEKYSVATANSLEIKARKELLNLLYGAPYESYTDGVSVGMPAYEALLIED